MRLFNEAGKRIKWSYCTRRILDVPATSESLSDHLCSDELPPRKGDVIVAEVLEIGRHSRVETIDGLRSQLFPGDLIGVVYGDRYATRQWRGMVPSAFGPCHMLSVGGVCGEVIDSTDTMSDPTIINPLGYLSDGDGTRANLQDYALEQQLTLGSAPYRILVVGSNMDSGKTTSAYSLVHGLMNAGQRVCAAKLTGTAASKDVRSMRDAGAVAVLDFSDAGHASTAGISREQLVDIFKVIDSNLGQHHPDYVVYEIADGLVQRETQMLIDILAANNLIDATIYACTDTLSVGAGVQRLRDVGVPVVAVSGMVACSPLAAQEAQQYCDLPILTKDQLRDASIAHLVANEHMSPLAS